MDRSAEPSVTVVVTNYNYGHFLGACLESVRRQTVPAEQVVVVDDGSTDGSRALLEAENDVETLLQENAGQAAAFNRGFAAARGDVVIFLDADDQLCPEAIEMVKRLWDPELAVLSYDLTLIDEAAHEIGRYPMAIPARDRLAQLRTRLQFAFMPTSGNAFSRARLAWAFPLPESRWRISADTLLVRLAMLSGRAVHLPHALGRYTAHGQNNFYTEGLTRQGTVRRSLIDTADAGLDLIAMARERMSPIGAEVARDIARAALEVRLRAEVLKRDPPGLTAFLARLARVTGPATARRLPRVPVRAVLPRSRKLSEWALHPGRAPRIIAPLLWPRSSDGRAPEPGDADVLVYRRRALELQRHLRGDGWIFGPHGESAELCAEAGWLVLRRLTDTPSRITLELPHVAPATTLEVSLGDQILAKRRVVSGESVALSLPAPDPIAPAEDVLRISCHQDPRWRHGKGATRRLEVGPVEIATAPVPVPAIVPSTVATTLEEAQVFAPGEALLVARPPLDGDALLALTLGADQPRGRLTLDAEGVRLFDGTVTPGQRLLIDMPPSASQDPLLLAVGFQAEAPLDEPRILPVRIGWIPGQARRGSGPPVLIPGRRYSPAEPGLIAGGWTLETSDGAVMHGASAMLALTLPRLGTGDAPVLTLDLARIDPPPGEQDFVVVATSEDQTLATANLRGRGILEVPLLPDHDPVRLALHAAPIPLARHAGLRLLGLELTGCTPAPLPETRRQPRPRSQLRDLLHRIEAALETPAGTDRTALRNEALSMVAGLSESGAKTLTPADLSLCARLGAGLPPRDAHSPPKDTTAGGWLRWLARAMLSGPAWRTMPQMQLSAFDPGAIGFATVIGRYLAQNPVLDTPDEARAYAAWITARHHEAKSILATRATTSWAYALARSFVHGNRPIGLYFQDVGARDAVRALSASLETLLLRDGHNLLGADIRTRPRAEGDRTRVAILLRHAEPAPETWILRGLLRSLDPERFAVTVYLLEASSPEAPLLEGASVVALGQLPVGMAVADIRDTCPDVALLGSVALGYSTMSCVAAHRLAPRQIALSAVFPLSSGLRSVDQFVLGELVTPQGAETDYIEETVLAPGTGQPFHFAAHPAADVADTWRARLGIGAETPVLVSGAMHDKITPGLLDAWVEILSGAPEAVLVLYPFAQNWLREFDTDAFLAKVEAACTEAGVARDRVKILAPIPHDRVLRLLSEADLYLDSFPFSGATTVAEALTSGCPVVTHAGQSQRCHQGSGWLKAVGLSDCVAEDRAAYVGIAARLVTEPDALRALKERVAAGTQAALRQDAFGAWFASFLAHTEARAAPRYLFHHMPKAGGTTTRLRSFALVQDRGRLP